MNQGANLESKIITKDKNNTPKDILNIEDIINTIWNSEWIYLRDVDILLIYNILNSSEYKDLFTMNDPAFIIVSFIKEQLKLGKKYIFTSNSFEIFISNEIFISKKNSIHDDNWNTTENTKANISRQVRYVLTEIEKAEKWREIKKTEKWKK